MLVVALAAAFAFLRSPYFHVTEIQVDGLRTVTAAEVAAYSGLEAGVSIWAVDPTAVGRRIESHPAVAGAWVTRRWPNRIHVQIMEREAVARIGGGTTWYLVDGQGVPFRVVESPPEGLPEIRAPDGPVPVLGQALPRPLDEAARLAAYLHQYGIDWVEAVQAQAGDLILWLEGQVPVYFGPAGLEPERKLAVVSALWAAWRDDAGRVRYMDVRNPDHPAVRTDTE
ncbi:MAG: FtsQ-type POTRA domain-containing protein [Thermaerobacter sp.]